MGRDRLRVVCYSLVIGVALLGIWQASVAGNAPGKGLPGPAAVARAAGEMLANPFYNNGPNDKGIGLQLLASLGRLAVGYAVASLVAIAAAEMLIGGTGIGYFVWNEWNNLALTSVIFAIIAIGLIGVLLDAGLGRLSRRLAWSE